MKKQILKRCISFIIAVAIILPCITIPSFAMGSSNLNDVTNYYPFSSWAVETGIKYKLVFLENNSRNTKRIEIVSIISSLLNLRDKDENANIFNDINDLSDSEKSKIEALVTNNIISGYSDGSFKPNGNVTRAEFVTILDRSGILEKYYTESKIRSFNDITNHWAKKGINNIVSTGIMSGKGQNKFSPDDYITPQEIFIILDRLVKLECINSTKLVDVMTTTFECKQYGREEQFVIEMIYSRFDKVQNEINFRWLYKDSYNPTNWQELATFEDLMYAVYYCDTKNTNPKVTTIDGKSKLDMAGKSVLGINGLEYNKSNLSKTITMRNLLYGIFAGEMIKTFEIEDWNDHFFLFKDELIQQVKYSNFDTLSERDKGIVADACVQTFYNNKVYENNTMYLPLDMPVTKYMLNHMIIMLQKRYDFFETLIGENVKEFFGLSEIDIETDYSKLPKNYKDFPYIVKGVPKEIYEVVIDRGYIERHDDPKECHSFYPESSAAYKNVGSKYFDLVLNVDYRTMNIENFVQEVEKYSFTPMENAAREYAQYVIDNKIILKGKGCVIPGTYNILNYDAQVRAVIKFEIISATKKENLLYGDLDYISSVVGAEDVVYSKNEYTIACDYSVAFIMHPLYTYIREYKMYPQYKLPMWYGKNMDNLIIPD